MKKQTVIHSKRQQNIFIEDLYYKIARIMESRDLFDRYVNIVDNSERGHRKFKPDGLPKDGLTIKQAVRYFACKYIIEGKTDRTPKIKDILYVKLECFHGYALYIVYQEKLSKLFTKQVIERFKTFDYAELM